MPTFALKAKIRIAIDVVVQPERRTTFIQLSPSKYSYREVSSTPFPFHFLVHLLELYN